MRILFITDLYPIKEYEKGIPLTLFNFVKGFVKFGAEVSVYRPNIIPNVLTRKRKIFKEGIYVNDGIKIYNDNLLLLPENIKSFNCKFIKEIKEGGFDVIVSHMPSGILAADIIKDELKIPMFLSVHASDIKVMEDFKYAIFLKKKMVNAYRNAALVLARSFWLKDKIIKIIPELQDKTEVIPSGIKKEYLEKEDIIKEKFKSYGTSKIKILTVSSLIKRKNIHSLIKAVDMLNNEKNGWLHSLLKAKDKSPKRKFTLEIIGDGPYQKKLVNLAQKIPNIYFLGKLSNEEVLKKMKESHIFILPSLNETFGMVYIEAMAKASFVICAENSGVDGIIKDSESGFLTKTDVKSIAGTLKKAMYLKREEIKAMVLRALDIVSALNEDAASKNYLDKISMFNI